MNVHAVWTADTKQAEAEVARLDRSNQALDRRIRALIGSANRGARAQRQMGQTTIKSAGDAGKAVHQLEAEHVRLHEELRKIQQQSKRAADEQKRMAQAGTQIFEETRTGQERYTARMRELNGLVRKGAIDQETYARAARQAREALQQQNAAAQGGLARWAGGLSTVLGSYLSLHGAIRLVTDAIREQDELRERAQQTHLSIAETEAAALLMLPEKTPAMAAAYGADVERIARQVRPRGGKAAIHDIMAETLSAAGDLELAAEATETGLRFARHDAEAAKAIAAGSLDLVQILGEREDMTKNMGWLLAALKQSRVTSPEAMAKYAVPAITGVIAQGATAEEAVSLYNALTKALADPEGRRSRTAAITIAQDLAEAMPPEDVYKTVVDPITGAVEKTLLKRGTGLESFAQRWEALMADPELRERFTAEYVAKAEKQMQGGYFAMIGAHPDERMNRLFRETYEQSLRAMPTVAEAKREAEQTLDVLERPYAQRIAKRSEALDAALEQLRTETQLGRRRAAEADLSWFGERGLSKVLAESGAGQMERWANFFEYWGLPRSREAAYRDVLQTQIEDLRGKGLFGRREISGDEARRAEILETRLRQLDEEFSENLGRAAPTGSPPIAGPMETRPPIAGPGGGAEGSRPAAPIGADLVRQGERSLQSLERLTEEVRLGNQRIIDGLNDQRAAIERQTRTRSDGQIQQGLRAEPEAAMW